MVLNEMPRASAHQLVTYNYTPHFFLLLVSKRKTATTAQQATYVMSLVK